MIIAAMRPMLRLLPLVLLAAWASAAVVHVKADATGLGDGSSWADAHRALAAALAAAAPGDEVWVAAGTYRPGSVRSASFTIPAGVSVYGGFLGNEAAREARSGDAGLTVLSGDIGAAGVAGDNVYHVVTLLGGGAVALHDLTVRDGRADGGGADDMGGGIVFAGDGEAVTTIQVENCRVLANAAAGQGSGLFAGISTGLVLRRCLIAGNAQVEGKIGANSVAYVIGSETLTVDSCLVVGNGGSGEAFALYVRDLALVDTAVVANAGRGVTIGNGGYTSGTRTVRFCTFAGNAASDLYTYDSSFGTGTAVAVDACIVGAIHQGDRTTIATSWLTGVDGDPGFLAPGIPAGADGVWGTADDGYQLAAGSPCRDRSGLAGVPASDVTGRLRPQGRLPDLGAYEADQGGAAPVAIGGTASGSEDADLVLTVAGGDIDTPAAGLTGRVLSLPAIGSLLPSADGLTASGSALVAADLPYRIANPQRAVVYRPPADANGSALASIQVDLDDGQHTSFPATISIDITAVNDPPTIDAIPGGTISMDEDTPRTITLTGISAGTPGLAAGSPGREVQVLTVSALVDDPTLLQAPVVGAVAADGTATLTLAPVADAFGSTILRITVRDDGGGLDTTVITAVVVVAPVNDPPRLSVPSIMTMDEDGEATVAVQILGAGPANEDDQVAGMDLLATSADPGLVTVVGIAWDHAIGTALLHVRGVANAFGSTNVVVTLIDHAGALPSQVASGLLPIVVHPVNDPPQVAVHRLVDVPRGGEVVIGAGDLRLADPDATDAELRLVLLTAPPAGVLLRAGVALAAGDSFTQADIGAGLMVFRAPSAEASQPPSGLVAIPLAYTDGVIAAPWPETSLDLRIAEVAGPIIQLVDRSLSWREGDAALAVAPNGYLLGVAAASGTLIIDITAGARAGDLLALAQQGFGSGQVAVQGASVLVGGAVVGTWTGGGDGTALTIALSQSAAAERILHAVTFASSSRDPGTARTLRVTYIDDPAGTPLASPAASVPLAIIAVDDPPVPAAISLATVAGVARLSTLTADDPDSAVLTWSLVAQPEGAVVSLVDAAVGCIRIAAAAGATRRTSFTVAVSDGVSSPVALVVPLLIAGPEQSRLQPCADPPRAVAAGDLLRLDIPFTRADLDADARLEFALSADAPAGAVLSRLDDATCRLEWLVPADALVGGYVRFHVLAADAAGLRAGGLPIAVRVRAASAGNG